MAHRDFMRVAYEAVQRKGYQDLVLDFSSVQKAYPNGMIPIICGLDYLRRNDVLVGATLPTERSIQRLFLNNNWAHFLCPEKYAREESTHERHVSARRFKDGDQQNSVVNDLMDVVMRNMRMKRNVIAGLEWCVTEITDNVLNHAECQEGGIVQLTTFREAQEVAFAVGDSGRGILASLRQALPTLRNDIEALGEAIKAGVTRSPEAGQGNGLAGTMRIASMMGGTFEITSGQGQLIIRGGDSSRYPRGESQRFVGTLVAAQIKLDSDFNLAETLGFGGPPYQPIDLIEMQYETEDGTALRLVLGAETTGFGSRQSGLQIRNKCRNLLDADPTKPLVIDWAGIPIVSSSFADELVGKLFVELGPTGFAARIRNVGMEATIRTLVDTAILQRVAQSSPFVPKG